MAKRFAHVADIAPDLKVPYSARKRKDRGKWIVTFNAPDGKTVRALTLHDATGKTPPVAFHDDAKSIIKKTWRPPTLFPSLDRKTWDELLAEVAKRPGIRPETHRSFREGVRAVREVLPDLESPLDVSDDTVKRFCARWLDAPGKHGKARSRVTLSYYVRALSAFTNHLIAKEFVTHNPWRGVKTEQTGKKKRKKKPAPTEEQFDHFIAWLVGRYPDWTSLHALIELKAVSACRTADVCQLKTAQLRNNRITFTDDIVKTDEDRSFPLEPDMFDKLLSVAGPVWLWERLFAEIPKYRKASNGYPPEFSWRTIKYVINNVFREYNDGHPDRLPRLTPHALKRRAVTLTVRGLGSVDAAANALGIHSQTAKTHYLDTKQAFDSDAAILQVAAALRPKMSVPVINAPETHQGESDSPKSTEKKP